MISRTTVAFTLASLVAAATLSSAQQDPRTLPPADLSAVQAAGSWSFDWNDGAGGDISYGGTAMGVSEDGRFVYIACNSAATKRGIAKLEIPALGGRAKVVSPCQGPNETEIQKILPGWGGGQAIIGGVLEQGGRIVVSGYASYDANGATQSSHWSGPSLTSLAGPFAGTVSPGLVKSQMAPIPAEWRQMLGGPAFATSGYTSIISRQSAGAAFSVFDPATVTANGFQMKMLLGCPYTVPKCQTWTAWGPSTNGFEGAELAGGAFIVPGTRTLVVIEREGTGGECYGYTTNNQSLHGQPYPSPEGVRYCYSLADPYNQKGNKAYPYKLSAKLYDLVDLVAVKQGQKQPWDVKQYATVDLPGSGPGEIVTSGAYNPVRGEYYLLRLAGGGVNNVYVYRGFGSNGTPPPPPPPPTEICGDGIDNDNDGLIDENCTEICGDGIDNDLDGLVDENCPTGEKCGDGIDNDGDGLIDEGCPVPEKCGDLIDNDLDGLIDEGCAEPPTEICGDNKDNDNDGLVDEGCESQGAVPGTPQRLYGSVRRSTVSFKWGPPLTGGAATDYVLEAGFASGRTDITAPVGNVTFLSVPNVGKGRYYVRVRARNANGAGKPSNEIVLSVGCSTRPKSPSAVTATSLGGMVTLTWTDPDGCSDTTYNVSVGTQGGAVAKVVTTAESSATALLPAGNYVARIASMAETGVSDPVDFPFTVTGNGCVAPRMRLKLRTVVSGRRVGFFWSPLDPDIAAEDDALSPISYAIEAGTAAGGADIGVLPMGRGTQLIVDAPPGTYHIRVRPMNACGGGSASNEAKLVVK